MQFVELRELQRTHIDNILEGQDKLFTVNIDKDALWHLYLDSFPEGTNKIFRERREYDCSCCKQFIRSFGNVVAIKGNKFVSIWDFETNDIKYQPVMNALSTYIHKAIIDNVFVTKESTFGTRSNLEKLENEKVISWSHFYTKIPKKFVTNSDKSTESEIAKFRDSRNVFKRSLEEISQDAIETVLDIIAQKSLYKGEEWEKVLKKFLTIHKAYNKLKVAKSKEVFCWRESLKVGTAISKIKNHSIGVLLTSITEGVNLNIAVKKYEAIVAPTNYKRPKAIFTKKMVEQAQKKIIELGLEDSLGRRYATLADITVNNILFGNRNVVKKMEGNVFDELQQEVTTKPKNFDKIEEIPIEHFIENILPTMTNAEMLFENKHIPNLMSLIAPKIKTSETLFKWDNGFSWAYNGNIADSMKERVKAAGGNVQGIIRFSLQWNEDNDNQNDFDAHCIEPNGNHIWYQNAGRRHPSSGVLDVDNTQPGLQVAVENITWNILNHMQEGIYKFFVHNYSHRGGRSGFRAELEYEGQIYSFNYNKDICSSENVQVATIQFSKTNGITFMESLKSEQSSKTEWGIQTNQFHPVSICMFSPNYWDKQLGIGNRHYFFLMNNCINENQPNGFFNEFLRNEFTEHKRVFEALGNKMKVTHSNNQLSGLGFSSTKRNSIIIKGEGRFNRMVKVIF